MPRTSLFVNGLVAAKGLRRSVEQAGGTLHISVNALGDAFGRGRLTPRARTAIRQVLARAGLDTDPDLTTVAPGDWVTLRIATRPIELPSALGAAPATSAAAAPLAGLRSLLPAPRVTVSLVAAAGLLVGTALAVPDTDSGPDAQPAAAADAGDVNPSALEEAHRALLNGDYRAALKLTERGDPTLVSATRRQIVASLILDAQDAQAEGDHERAIRVARRAARFGSAPGASAIVRASEAAVRRAQQRRRAAAETRANADRERERDEAETPAVTAAAAGTAAPAATTTPAPAGTSTTATSTTAGADQVVGRTEGRATTTASPAGGSATPSAAGENATPQTTDAD